MTVVIFLSGTDVVDAPNSMNTFCRLTESETVVRHPAVVACDVAVAEVTMAVIGVGGVVGTVDIRALLTDQLHLFEIHSILKKRIDNTATLHTKGNLGEEGEGWIPGEVRTMGLVGILGEIGRQTEEDDTRTEHPNVMFHGRLPRA